MDELWTSGVKKKISIIIFSPVTVRVSRNKIYYVALIIFIYIRIHTYIKAFVGNDN